MTELDALGQIFVFVGDVDTELSLANEMFSVAKVDQQVAGGPLEAILYPYHLEALPRFGKFGRLHALEQLHDLLACLAGGLAAQKIIDEESELCSGSLSPALVLEGLEQVGKTVDDLLMSALGDGALEDELVGHALLRPHEVQELLQAVDFGDALDQRLAPLDENAPHRLCLVEGFVVPRRPLHLAVCQSLGTQHVNHVLVEVGPQVVCVVDQHLQVVHKTLAIEVVGVGVAS